VLNEQPFDFHRILLGLEEMFQLRAEQKGLGLTFDLAPDIPAFLQADEGKLRQVLMNLLGNAVKFTERGGVVLRVRSLQLESTAGETASEAIRLRFEVEDSGPGIAEEDLRGLFNPFVQSAAGRHAQEGTGLGLAISRQFTQLMGGELTVASEVGRGSTFVLEIPASAADSSALRQAVPSRRVVALAPGQPVYRVLIVDDKEVNRQLLVKLLSPLGFEIRQATNGLEACEVWDSWAPHLILMDMRMPIMDGYEATRRIKASTRGQATVIVALTASALEEDRKVILSEGCDAYLRKPFREHELFDTLAKHLGLRFVYEELPPESGAGRSAEEAQREADRERMTSELARLPARLTADLEKAVVLGDVQQIEALLEQVRIQNASLAEYLATLAKRFEHADILALLKAAEARRD
jgi:CheY-like chemotaxis protein